MADGTPQGPVARPWWLWGVLVAGFALGGWMRDPTTSWGAAAIVGLLATGVLALPWRGWGGGRLVLAGTAVAFAGTLFLQQVRLYQLQTAWPDHIERQIVQAADRASNDMRQALDRVESLALRALSAADLPPPATFDALATLARDQTLETGVAILTGDGDIYAWAGRHRVTPALGSDTLTLRVTPFFASLVSWKRHPGTGRVAFAAVLLDARPGVPERPISMASRFAAQTGVGLEVYSPGSVADSLDPFDYQVPSGDALRTLYTVRFRPPTQGQAMEAALEQGNHRAAWFLVVLICTALVVARGATNRFLLLSVLLWVAIRAPAGEALGLDTLFSPAVFFPGRLPDRSLFGVFSRSAGVLMLTAVVVAFVAVYAWSRALPRRAAGTVIGGLLLLATPFVVQELGRGITPPAAGVPTGLWLAWHVTLLLSTGALLLLVAALVRGSGDPPERRHWPVAIGILTGLAATAIGLATFAGRSGWPDWYWLLWVPPLVCGALPLPRRRAILVVAVVAGSASALMTWAAEVEGRVALARQDFLSLGAEPDPLAEPMLASFGDRLHRTGRGDLGGGGGGATDLYDVWVGSGLQAERYPSELSLWKEGREAAHLRLHRLDLPVDSMAMLVRDLPDSVGRRIITVRRSPGVHYVLLERLDSATVVSVVVGPRSVLLSESRLGRLLSADPELPLYRMLRIPSPDTLPFRGREQWHREGWLLKAERAYLMPEGRRTVQAVVDLGDPALLLVRGALLLFLDVGLIALVWSVGELMAGQHWRRPDWASLGRSFRIRLGVALAGFFLLPAAGFAAWSFTRLRVEAVESRDLVIGELLRDATTGLGRDDGPTLPARLADRSERMDTELGYYRGGVLVAASTTLLPDLGLLDPLMSARAYRAMVESGQETEILASPAVGPPHRTGYRLFHGTNAPESDAVAIRMPAGDPELGGQALDVAMVLLLATLLGILAAFAGARFAARALSRPVRDLREAALRFGRGLDIELPVAPPPMEFAPVFGAFERMVADIRGSRAALEESRRQTAAVLSTVATGVVGLDGDGRILIANHRARELLGSALEEHTRFADVLPGPWEEVGRKALALLADEHVTPVPIEVEGEEDGSGGGAVRLSIQFARLRGTRPGLVIAVTDITDVARAARVLAWGEMASQIAHEVKNPLTPMRLGVQHLQRVYRDGRERFGDTLAETSQRILGEIDRLDTIARAFSRYAAPSDTSRPLERVRVGEVVAEVLDFYGLSPQGVEIVLKEETEFPVAARRDELKEVLINLLENARTAGARRIIVRVRAHEFSVEDDGRGIPSEFLPRIFEPRFSTTTSGSGLGLAIVRRLVEGWSGLVEVESEVGRGTIVRVSMPLSPPA